MIAADAYLEALSRELRDLGPDVRRMLEEPEAAVEPMVLLSLVQCAALARHLRDDLDDDVVVMAEGLFASARRSLGARRCAAVFDDLDLEGACALGDPARDDELELEAGFHDVFELGFLVDVLVGERRDRLVRALEDVALELAARADAFVMLYDTAFILHQLVPLPPAHPVEELLDVTLMATDDVAAYDAPVVAAEHLGHVVDGARARVASANPVERFLRRVRAWWGDVADLFAPAEVVFAASVELRPEWPSPRLVLMASGSHEVAVHVEPRGLVLEVVDGDAVERRALVSFEEGDQIVDDGESWPLPQGRVAAPPEHGLASRPFMLESHARAPGALRAELLRLAAAVEGESRALALDFTAQAARVSVRPLAARAGEASFVVVAPSILGGGMLARVRVGVFGGGLPAERVGVDDAARGRVAGWVGALVGQPDAIDPSTLTLRFDLTGATLEGDSWELAAALAVISERLASPRAIVVSAALGTAVGEVRAVTQVELKKAVLAAELVGVSDLSRIVERDGDFKSELARLFGPDWTERLRASLGIAGDDLARAASRTWQRWFGRRNTSEATSERERALEYAQRALAAGVKDVHRLEALWVEGACRLHRGETLVAKQCLDEVDSVLEVLDPRRVPSWIREELAAYRGIALIDLGWPELAVETTASALARMDDARLRGAGDRRFHEVRLQVAGTLARGVLFAGALDRARALLTESLTLGLDAERARTSMDLAEVERRSGDLVRASAHLAAARSTLDAIPNDAVQAFTTRFLVLYEARAGAGPADYTIEAPSWSAWPQPLEVLESLLMGPPDEVAAWCHAHVVPHATSLATAHLLAVLGASARALLAHASMSLLTVHAAVVAELVARDVEPGLNTMLEALRSGADRGALQAWVERCPY